MSKLFGLGPAEKNALGELKKERRKWEARLNYLDGPPEGMGPPTSPLPPEPSPAPPPTEQQNLGLNINLDRFSPSKRQAVEAEIDGIKEDAAKSFVSLEITTLKSRAMMADMRRDFGAATALTAAAIRKTADVQIEEWEKVATRVPELAETAAAAIKMINEQAANDIATIQTPEMERLQQMADQLGVTFAGAFEDATLAGEDLGDIFKSLIADVVRLIIRLTVIQPLAESIAKSFGNFGGGGGFLSSAFQAIGSIFGGGRAAGGVTLPNRTYLVGEEGPEFLRMGQTGTVIPNHLLAGDGSGGVHITINAPGADAGTLARLREIATAEIVPQAVQAARGAVMNDLTRPRFA